MLYGTYILVVMTISSLGIGDKKPTEFAKFPAKELCEFERQHVESRSTLGEKIIAVCVPTDQK